MGLGLGLRDELRKNLGTAVRLTSAAQEFQQPRAGFQKKKTTGASHVPPPSDDAAPDPSQPSTFQQTQPPSGPSYAASYPSASLSTANAAGNNSYQYDSSQALPPAQLHTFQGPPNQPPPFHYSQQNQVSRTDHFNSYTYNQQQWYSSPPPQEPLNPPLEQHQQLPQAYDNTFGQTFHNSPPPHSLRYTDSPEPHHNNFPPVPNNQYQQDTYVYQDSYGQAAQSSPPLQAYGYQSSPPSQAYGYQNSSPTPSHAVPSNPDSTWDPNISDPSQQYQHHDPSDTWSNQGYPNNG
ncbi:hypothetical protein EJ04DRAFT_528267 [Polyplosphaeria fusca]|uniref:Uncharacterized protein n=1 Tax=Polyplosphaeria fusca TaxID=682080 RepID=A0A9P4QQ35_9PLEO|nr:hypothetical protein EJ04DRAFT_528267 [Polyplosphaeria fusca]